MRNLLLALHYAHNGGLRFVIAICRNPFMCLLVLLLRLFGLYLIDFDAVLGMREIEIYCENVAGVDVLAFGMLTQDSIPRAGKGLQRSLQFNIVWISQPCRYTSCKLKVSLPSSEAACRSL